MPYTRDTFEENDIPDPELLIKSIAEQGYTLQTSLADLIDNSITADASQIEILIDTDNEPFMLFLADNGNGMSREMLAKNMKFPSASPEHARVAEDLGRFGLGMKTASFAQTRVLTVLSREKGSETFYGKTWDVEYLQREKQWKTIDNSQNEIRGLLAVYNDLSRGFHNQFRDYIPNTIIIWKGLYKFEKYAGECKKVSLQREITEITSEYLSLVFHRYMERKQSPLFIRINNNILTSFNPFPADQTDFRRLEASQAKFKSDALKIEGYVLPSRSLDESKNGHSIWTQSSRSLMDMEGLYIYRADRIILFGGWNGIIKKSPRLQLARLKVDIGNSVDHYFQLNVAKSSIIIPYELRMAFLRYVSQLKIEAEKEYYNRGVKKLTGSKTKPTNTLFIREASSEGMVLSLNDRFPLIRLFTEQLTEEQRRLFRTISGMINTAINRIRQVHEDKPFIASEKAGMAEPELIQCIKMLKDSGLSVDQIEETLFNGLGLIKETIPLHILNILT
jgi:signal transduction histidine kinase